jgi:hypothetical protein
MYSFYFSTIYHFLNSSMDASISNCKHYPYCTNVLWVSYDLYSNSMFNTVSSRHHNFLTNFILKNMMNHSLCVKMSELNWESLESMIFRYIVLDARLKFISGKGLTSYNKVLGLKMNYLIFHFHS